MRGTVGEITIKGATYWNVFAHDRLLELLPDWDSKRNELEQQQKNRKAGLAGEERVIEVLWSAGLSNDTVIFWDVSLPLTSSVSIQMDIVMMNKHGILIFESKQIAGRLRFVHNPAALQKLENDEVKLVMDCPATQFEDQRESLSLWLKMRGFQVPVGGSVVFTTNPIIEGSHGLPIIGLRELRSFIRAAVATNPVLASDELQLLVKTIEKNRSRFIPYPLCERYRIDPYKLPWGPRCRCGSRLIKATERRWDCEGCTFQGKVSYGRILLDWFLLGSKTITVQQCAALFGIHRQSAWRLLNRFSLTKLEDKYGKHPLYTIDYTDFEVLNQLLNS